MNYNTGKNNDTATQTAATKTTSTSPSPTSVSNDASHGVVQDLVNKAWLDRTPPPSNTPEDDPIPALPFSLPTYENVGHFVDEYVQCAKLVSPLTPRLFHESAALWLGSTSIARRFVLRMGFDDIYPNLFILWLAPTTLWCKSTALNVTRRLAYQTIAHLMAAQDTTTEAFLADLAGVQPTNLWDLPDHEQTQWRQARNFSAQRGLIYDEMSGLMASAGKDYNGGLLEAFLRFYDCDPQYVRSTKSAGRVAVKNAYLSILAASTPAAMSQHIKSTRLWAMGWWARFALLTPPTERPTWQKIGDPAEIDRQFANLVQKLARLQDMLPCSEYPQPPGAQCVTMTHDAHLLYQDYDKAMRCDLLTEDLDKQLWGTYGRLPVQSLKVALVLAALDWTGEYNAPTITAHHLVQSLQICETWRASAHRTITKSTMIDINQFLQRMLRHLSKFPDGASQRDLYRVMSDKTPDEIKNALNQLEQVDMIEHYESRGTGRRTIKYKLVTE